MNGRTERYVLFTEHAKYSDGWEQIFSKAGLPIPEQQRQPLDQEARSLIGGIVGEIYGIRIWEGPLWNDISFNGPEGNILITGRLDDRVKRELMGGFDLLTMDDGVYSCQKDYNVFYRKRRNSMNVVVTGGCGHIGTYLIPTFVRAGHEVINITRGISRPYVEDEAWDYVTPAIMDRENDRGFAHKIAGMELDIVVDLINFHVKDTEAMAEVLKGTKLFHHLFCPSVWAHGRAEILPADPVDLQKASLDDYGFNKFQSGIYLREQYHIAGFPAAIITPGQIFGPGWTIMDPWVDKTPAMSEKIAKGEEIFPPNFGVETLHHVYGEDVAQMFFKAITHRDQVLGETSHIVGSQSITLCDYAKFTYGFFGKEPRIGFLPWKDRRRYIGDEMEISDTYFHIARSGFYSIENARNLLGYEPRYTNAETIRAAVQSYVDRGVIKLN